MSAPERDIVVIGGGCYGTFYAGQLAKAKERGKIAYRRMLIVDRDAGCRAARELAPTPDRALVVGDWDGFFDDWLPRAAPDDQLVPPPFTPHLMFAWLVRRARARWPARAVTVAPLPIAPGTPYDRTAPDATRYVSFAAWVCPTHCIEPATCPATGEPRSWDMGESVRALVARLRAAGHAVHGPALFECQHYAFGVGTFAAQAVLAGDALVTAAGAGAAADVLVGTISRCHGALNLLRLGAPNPV